MEAIEREPKKEGKLLDVQKMCQALSFQSGSDSIVSVVRLSVCPSVMSFQRVKELQASSSVTQ